MPMRFARSIPPGTLAELVDAMHRQAKALTTVGGPIAAASAHVGVAFALLADELGDDQAAIMLVTMARAAPV